MSREIMEHLGEIYSRLSELEGRHERMIRPGTIPSEGGIDNSDPAKPRFRIQHGTDKDGKPVLGPWLPMMMHAGEMNRWTPPSPGMQMVQFAPDGVFENGVLIPFTHSQDVPAPSTDLDRHVSQFGDHREDHGKKDHTRTIGGTSVHQDAKDHRVNVPGKIVHTAGDPAAAASSGAGDLQNFPHELNRIVQGFAARLDQHDHHIAAMHDQASSIIDLALPKVPALAALLPTLNHAPSGLLQAAQSVLGRLPSYSASAIEQTLAKLLGGSPLGAVTEALQGDIAGQITPMLGQLGAMLGAAGLSPAQASTASMLMGQAQGGIVAAAAGGPYALSGALSGIASLAAGTPVAGQVGDLIGQIQGAVGSASSLMGGLSGLLDGQVNATKGTIKSALFGGYGS